MTPSDADKATMSVTPALSDGGTKELPMLQAALHEAHMIMHAPPDFPENSRILGVCGVSDANADQNKYGWMVADFLRWKMLLHGVGKKQQQIWASSLDIPKFLAGVDGVDMIKDGTIDQIVGDDNEDIQPLPSDNKGFVDEFLEYLTVTAKYATLRKTALVVAVFAPVTPEQDICVDFGGKKTYLTAEKMRDTIKAATGDAVLPVMLITPSALTGGWSCRPFMNWPPCDAPDKMMRVIAKSCGGAFANDLVRIFTHRGCPLMTKEQRGRVRFDDPMPVRPTELQTDSLNRLHRQVHESLEHRLSASAREHGFIMKPESDPSSLPDAWSEYGPRKGRPLSLWADGWRTPSPAVTEVRRFEFLGEAFGGTSESQAFHLKYLTEIEQDTYPGDWDRRVNGNAAELYETFRAKESPSEEEAKRIFDAIEFRASSMILAHMVAKAFDLPLPDGLSARYWHDEVGGGSYYDKLQTAFSGTSTLFDKVAMFPGEQRHPFKHVRFIRASRWLSAAIARRFEAVQDCPREHIVGFVEKDVARFIEQIKDTQKALLMQDQDVKRAALSWVAALGLDQEVPPHVDNTAAASTAPGVRLGSNIGTVKPEESTKLHAAHALLNAQAAPWPSRSAEVSAMNPLVTLADAESSLAPRDAQHAVEYTEIFGSKSVANDDHHVTQDWCTTLTEADGANADSWEEAINRSMSTGRAGEDFTRAISADSARHQPKPANLITPPQSGGAEAASSHVVTDRATLWGQAINAHLTGRPPPRTWPRSVVHGPAGKNDKTPSTWTTPGQTSAEPTPAATAQHSTGHRLKTATDSLLAKLPVDSLDADAAYLVRVLKKAVELLDNESAESAESASASASAATKNTLPAAEHPKTNGHTLPKGATQQPNTVLHASWRTTTPASYGSVRESGRYGSGTRTAAAAHIASPPATTRASDSRGRSWRTFAVNQSVDDRKMQYLTFRQDAGAAHRAAAAVAAVEGWRTDVEQGTEEVSEGGAGDGSDAIMGTTTGGAGEWGPVAAAWGGAEEDGDAGADGADGGEGWEQTAEDEGWERSLPGW